MDHRAPLSIGFSRQEYSRVLPFSSPADLPDSGIEFESPALAGEFFTTEPPGKPLTIIYFITFACIFSNHITQKT